MALHPRRLIPFLPLLLAACAAIRDPRRPVHPDPVHLGVAGTPEWSEFEGRTPDGAELKARFDVADPSLPHTLFVRQSGVKQTWPLRVNGKRIGQLPPVEQPLVHAVEIPPGSLRGSGNTVTLGPSGRPDDIVISSIALLDGPLAPHLGGLEIVVTEDGGPVPCRLTIVDDRGALAPLWPEEGQRLAVRPGTVCTPDGRARIRLLPGRYTVYANRGFEYGVDSRTAAVTPGSHHALALSIRREVPTPGLVACDTHIHTRELSGHGDATVDERVITLAAEGIELAIATEHNRQESYAEAARRMGVASRFTPVVGNEVTTRTGHFNIFPVRPGGPKPDPALQDWPALMRSIREDAGAKVVILNHPRDLHAGFRPFGPGNFDPKTGRTLRGFPFTFDAFEAINSAAMQSELLGPFHDWMAIMNHGTRVAAIGASDSHDVARFLVGQGRTYVACPDGDASRLDVDAACDAFVTGRVQASIGLLTHLEVTGGDVLTAEVRVLGPSWITADCVQLFANGTLIFEGRPRRSFTSLKASLRWMFPRPKHDVTYVAIATGPGPEGPFWQVPRPYQATSPEWTARVVGASRAVRVDGDRDGKHTSPREYAERLLGQAAGSADRLANLLKDFDPAVAAQAAALLKD